MSVTVIDSIMGTGKTSYAIKQMKEAPLNKKYIYITPYLEEVKRVKLAIPERDFKEPDNRSGHGTKMKSLKKLVAEGRDIVTTHALFSKTDDELKDLIQLEDYTLIIDEVQEVVSILDTIKKADIEIMLQANLIRIEEGTNRVIWIADTSLNSKYNEVKEYALSNNLYSVNGTAFIWSFPSEVFSMFDHVYILTYMFDGQLQKYYYDYHEIVYTKKSIRDGELVDYYQEDRSQYKGLIVIYEGKLNELGDNSRALSKKWFSSKEKMVKKLKADLYNYLRNVQGAKSEEILWTTFKGYHNKISGKGFTKGFIPFTTRATNDFKERSVLAFCLNRYMNPYEEKFFLQRDIKVNQELLALSDLLQWIFRSRIREGQPIEIYIPSSRMRKLLYQWLEGEL